jgi:signal transduction histidine kinase/ligand-binding sensor domain-containing protein
MRASVARSRRVKRLRRLALLAFLVFTLCPCPATVCAQDLPAVRYSSNDGLIHAEVNRISYDPRGFLWIGGSTAITRFDGETFTAYGRPEGLDVGTGVNDLRPDARGDLWVATNGAGIFKLDRTTTSPAARFTQLTVGTGRASNRVNVLIVLENQLWAGTDAGLFLGSPTGEFTRVPLPPPTGQEESAHQVVSIAVTPSSVWVGASTGAYRCDRSSARCVRGPQGRARTLLLDDRGRLWIGRDNGIERWQLDAGANMVGQPEMLGAGWRVRRMFPGSDGVLIATDDRRIVSINDRTARVLFTSSDAQAINDVVEDAARNLWVGTTSGLVGVRRQGVTLFSAHQRLRPPHLLTVRSDSRGHPYALAEEEWVHRIEGEHVTAVRLVLPTGVRRAAWRSSSIHIDAAGDLWLGTTSGLYRFSRPPFSTRPVSVAPSDAFTMADGLAGQHVADIFEDSKGDVWIANVPAGAETLTIWRRRSSRFERLGATHGMPASNQLNGFVEDTHGAVWARLREGGLVRIRDGKATVFGADHGVPAFVSITLVDRGGNLWVSGADSLLKITDTAADVIQATPVLTGLNTTIHSLAEHRSGLLILGGRAGLLIFDPDHRKLRHFSGFEGFPQGTVLGLVSDRDGALLAAAGQTLARVVLPTESPPDEPLFRCLLSAVRVGGQPLPMPEAGPERLAAPDIQPARNQIEIEIVGLSSRLGEPLTYEYRLVGVANTWARASDRRVNYVGLAAGRYTFEARVAGADSTSVSRPAVLAFTVLPPWYRRWWFFSLVAAASLLMGYLAHHVRLAQAIRTERLRSRIATDLHDDIGSSLSQIAILAEVARRRAGVSEPGFAERLASIATTSRDLVDAMSDIVWAVNPRTDSLSDLTRRMHRFAEETLGGADIALNFSAPPADVDLKIGTDLRREIYLILKESVNNIARHSGASEAVVELTLGRHELRLAISDNGRGFDPGIRVDGNGIASMRKRAVAFGGVFTIESAAGRGTRVSLTANLRRQPR